MVYKTKFWKQKSHRMYVTEIDMNAYSIIFVHLAS